MLFSIKNEKMLTNTLRALVKKIKREKTIGTRKIHCP